MSGIEEAALRGAANVFAAAEAEGLGVAAGSAVLLGGAIGVASGAAGLGLTALGAAAYGIRSGYRTMMSSKRQRTADTQQYAAEAESIGAMGQQPGAGIVQRGLAIDRWGLKVSKDYLASKILKESVGRVDYCLQYLNDVNRENADGTAPNSSTIRSFPLGVQYTGDERELPVWLFHLTGRTGDGGGNTPARQIFRLRLNQTNGNTSFVGIDSQIWSNDIKAMCPGYYPRFALGDNPSTNFRGAKGYLKSARVRLWISGARTNPQSVRIMLVKFNNPGLNNPTGQHVGGFDPYNAGQNDDRDQFWGEFAQPLVGHPFERAVARYGVTKRPMKLLKEWCVVIPPDSSTNQDVLPLEKIVDLKLHLNHKVMYYDQVKTVGSFANPDAPRANVLGQGWPTLGGVNFGTRSEAPNGQGDVPPDESNRLWLIVCGPDYEPYMNSRPGQVGSFDIKIETRHLYPIFETQI